MGVYVSGILCGVFFHLTKSDTRPQILGTYDY